MEPLQQPQVREQPYKRRKVALACEKCRERKVRCDGQRPTCGPCMRRQTSHDQNICTYGKSEWQQIDENNYILSLQDRIRKLEASRSLGESLQDFSYACDSNTARSSSPMMDTEQTLEQASMRSPQSPKAFNSRLSNPPTKERSTHSYIVKSTSTFAQLFQNLAPAETHGTKRIGSAERLNLGSDTPRRKESEGAERSSLHRARSSSMHDQRPSGKNLYPEGEFSLSSMNYSPKVIFQSSPPDSDSPVNAMGAAVTTNNPEITSAEAFYGNSSAISFFQQVQGTLQGQSVTFGEASYRTRASPKDVHGLNLKYQHAEFSLPTRKFADTLLEIYWDRANCLYPFIHWKTFELAYRKIWEADEGINLPAPTFNVGLGSSNCNSSVFYCALNAMFALSCNFTNMPESDRQRLCDKFSQRSLDLLNMNLLDNGSLALVQTLLIVAQYLQSTDMPSRCWNVVGLALRVAQGLGLHMDQPHKSDIEREIRRRTWHGCLMLDNITSMTLGRPAIISGNTEVPLPLELDDNCINMECETGCQSHDSFSINSFYVQTLKLYRILGEVLIKLYGLRQKGMISEGGGESRQRDASINIVVELEGVLSDFVSDLPSQLRWDLPTGNIVQSSTLIRQRNVLHTRYLHLKILLYRPLFHKFCRRSMPATGDANNREHAATRTIADSLGKQYFEACVVAAQELIALIEKISLDSTGGAWWYNIFYIFTSAMVLISASLSTSSEEKSEKYDFKSSWNQCFEYLDRLVPHYASARRCADTLSTLREQLAAGQKSLPISNARQETVGRPVARPAGSEKAGNDEILETSQLAQETQVQINNESSSDTYLQSILWQQSDALLPWASQDQMWWEQCMDRL